MRGVEEVPAGLQYVPDAISPQEERSALTVVDPMHYDAVVLHGQAAKRTVAHFGYRYGYDARTVTPTAPLPEALEWLRERVALLSGVAADDLVEALVTRYPAGAGIGWHRDAPMFGSPVVGVSLGGAGRLQFQRTVEGIRRTHELPVAPRSAYVLTGPARWSWQHHIPPTRELRYSVTFRTLRGTADLPSRSRPATAQGGARHP